MEKRQDGLAPFSSDECPNSGEDSDEDVVTDYLNPDHTDCPSAPAVVGELVSLSIDGTGKTADYNTKDNHRDTMSESCDDPRNPPTLAINRNQQNPLVPTISVTPHSPGLTKHYPVLEDNLQQLQEIHNSIQRMRESTQCTVGYRLLSQTDTLQRLSASCPSLCPLGSMARGTDGAPGSDPDLANCSTNSSPTHFPQGQLPPGMLGVDRRRSWTDLEESRQKRHRCGVQNHLQAQNMRQRSISLSSLDSDMDLEIDGKSRSPCANVANRSCRSQTSTHSLNEADFVQIDPHKSGAKRVSQRLTEGVNLLPGVTGSRLPLQKSISTPSIIGPPEQAPLCEGTRVTPSLPTRHERNEKGSGSETETEDASHSHAYHGDIIREGSLNVQTSLDELMTDGTVYDDHHSEKTRRKRGSLFFRKKKDKSGKKPSQQNHHWVTMSAQGNYICDHCMKQFGHKSVLYCEICGVMVHQNQSCKDQMLTDCVKQKNNSHKGSTKSMSSVSIVMGSGHVKRGSTVSLPPASSTGTNRRTGAEIVEHCAKHDVPQTILLGI